MAMGTSDVLVTSHGTVAQDLREYRPERIELGIALAYQGVGPHMSG